jgi:hypothetical protein
MTLNSRRIKAGKVIAIAVLIGSVLVGCASQTAPVQNPSLAGGECNIFLYRPSSPSPVGVAEVPFVYLNGERAGRLAKGRFLHFRVPPGEHKVEIRASFMTVLPFYSLGKIGLLVQEGEEIYLRFVADVDEAHKFGPAPPMTTFLRVSPERGLEEMKPMLEREHGLKVRNR